jgi:hypothetical protein
VLYCSGYAPEKLLAETPGARILAKPFTRSDLMARVDEALDG